MGFFSFNQNTLALEKKLATQPETKLFEQFFILIYIKNNGRESY
jgi:hypothetical protein